MFAADRFCPPLLHCVGQRFRLFHLALATPKGNSNQTICHFCRKLGAPDQGIWLKDRGHLCQECLSAIQDQLANT